MPTRLWILLVVILISVGCGRWGAPNESRSLPPESKAAVEESARSFMLTVAHDVTEQGPTAWSKLFADEPAFFMANNGLLVFPDKQSAEQGSQAYARTIRRIELHWGSGSDLRIDVLTPELVVVATPWSEVWTDLAGHQLSQTGFFTGLVEFRNGHWQFRNAHWSVPVPQPKAG